MRIVSDKQRKEIGGVDGLILPKSRWVLPLLI